MEAEGATAMPVHTRRSTEAYPKLSESTAGTKKGQKVVLRLLLSNKICWDKCTCIFRYLFLKVQLQSRKLCNVRINVTLMRVRITNVAMGNQ